MGEHSEEAKQAFWELVEDFGEFSIHHLAHGNPSKWPVIGTEVYALAMTGGHFAMALVHAYHGQWDKVSESCVDMAASAANFASGGNFGAAKGIVWDITTAAHIADGKHGEMFSEITKHVVSKVGEISGNKVFEYFHPLSVDGSGGGVREYYESHPELYRGHMENGKMHYDRFIYDQDGRIVLLHPNFVVEGGQKVYLSPDNKIPYITMQDGKAKLLWEKLSDVKVPDKAQKAIEIQSKAQPSGKLDNTLKQIEALSKGFDSSKDLPSSKSSWPDASMKGGKLDNVLKQIESLAKDSALSKSPVQKSDQKTSQKMDQKTDQANKSVSDKPSPDEAFLH